MKRLPPNILWMGSEAGDKNSSDNIEEVKYGPSSNWQLSKLDKWWSQLNTKDSHRK